MLPKTLSKWVQHYGHAGHGGQPAQAIILVEPSAFQAKKIKNHGEAVALKDKHSTESQEEAQTRVDKEDGNQCVHDCTDGDRVDEVEYKKSVEDGLHKWLEVLTCRRIVQDEYFKNSQCRHGTLHLLTNSRH